MKKSTVALLVFMMLPFAGQVYAARFCSQKFWGYVVVKDGFPFKSGSLLTTILPPNCEDSDGNVIRQEPCTHLEPGTKGWAARLESAGKKNLGSDNQRNLNFEAYLNNGSTMWIARSSDKRKDLFMTERDLCNPSYTSINGFYYCKWRTTMGNLAQDIPIPDGVDGFGSQYSADNIISIYDPQQDRYIEYGASRYAGWSATISGPSPGTITKADVTTYDTNSNPIVNEIQIVNGDKIRFSSASAAAMPTNINIDTIYYAVNSDGKNFQVSASSGGTPIDVTVGTAPADLVVIDSDHLAGGFGGAMSNASQWDGIWTQYIGGDGTSVIYGDPHTKYAPGAYLGFNAVGIAQMALTVSVAEIEAGHIQHAVGLVVPEAHLGVSSPYFAHTYPATKNDYNNFGQNYQPVDCSLPEGARLRLDPEVWTDDVINNYLGGFIDQSHPYGTGNGWGVPPQWVKTIMKAARDYGFIISDTGSNLNVRFQEVGYRGVLKYDGTQYSHSAFWEERTKPYHDQKTYMSGWGYNQYPQYLPGTPYQRPDGNGMFKGVTAPNMPNAPDSSANLAKFPVWALQTMAFEMNGATSQSGAWPKPTCTCTTTSWADGVGHKTTDPALYPCYTTR
jgi:hypothetical protein